jgi:hypothetical protein
MSMVLRSSRIAALHVIVTRSLIEVQVQVLANRAIAIRTAYSTHLDLTLLIPDPAESCPRPSLQRHTQC